MRVNLFETPNFKGWIIQSGPDKAEKYNYSFWTKSSESITFWRITGKGEDQIKSSKFLNERVIQGKFLQLVLEIAPHLSISQIFHTLEDIARLKIDLAPFAVYRVADHAIIDHTANIALNPNAWGDYLSRAVAHAAKGNIDAAIADYTTIILKAERNHSAFIGAYEGRAMAYLAKGKFDLAIADFATAIQLLETPDPTFYYKVRANGVFGLAIAYQSKGDLDAAIANYNQVIADD
jgi:tetratricopeptide (TPR) repeat protein